MFKFLGGGTSADLDDNNAFLLGEGGGTNVPSNYGAAIPITFYFRDVLKLNHIPIFNVMIHTAMPSHRAYDWPLNNTHQIC
jgi:hypothetical protein